MVEVFKTDIRKTSQAKAIITLLLQHFPGSIINFDLEDCDKILRVEGADDLLPERVMKLIENKGFTCKILD